MYWRSDRKSKKSGAVTFLIPVLPAVPRRSPFGMRFVPSGLAIASDGWATARGGQVRSRDTNYGSQAVASSRIPRLRSRRVLFISY